MNPAAILRDVYGPHAAKKVAGRFGVAVITAKIWLAGRFPEHRTNQLREIVAGDLDLIDERNQEIRQFLGIAPRGSESAEPSNETGRSQNSVSAGESRSPAERMGGPLT